MRRKKYIRSIDVNNLIKIERTDFFYQFPKILLANLRSILNKFEQVLLFVETYLPDVIAFTETWIQSKDIDAFNIPDYLAFHNIRNNNKHHGGGVSLYVHKRFTVLNFKIPDDNDLEVLTLSCRPSLLPRSLPWISFVIVYYPPYDPVHFKLLNYINCEVDRLLTVNTKAGIHILGDFNELNTASILKMSGFHQIIQQPNRGDKILSKCFSNTSYETTVLILPQIASSDHNAILISPDQHFVIKSSESSIYVRERRKSNHIFMASHLSLVDWSVWASIDNVQVAADVFYDFMIEMVDLAYPIRHIKIKSNQHCWITKDIVASFKQRNILKKSDPNYQSLYRDLNLKIKNQIILAKRVFCSRLETYMVESPAKFHRLIKQSTNFIKKKKFSSTVIFGDLSVVQTNEEIKNYFNNLFNKHPLLENNCLFSSMLRDQEHLKLIELSSVFKSLQAIKINSSASPLDIPPFVYREFSFLLAEPISVLINMSLSQLVVPLQWKYSFLVPIPKVASPSEPSDLRPICISSPILKVCEKHILNNILSLSLSSIDQMQFGGIPGKSSSQYLSIYCHRTLQFLENPKSSVCTLVTDYSKAFDNVCHLKLLNDLIKINVPVNCILWLSSFLSNRHIIIKNGSQDQYSKSFPQSNGIPQGSVLGSFLFAVTVNDIAIEFDNRLKFVDDLSISHFASSQIYDELQLIADRVFCQSEDIHLPLNVGKCKILIHDFSLREKIYPTVQVQGQFIQVVDSVKILGLIIQNDLKWDLQVGNMICSANKRLYMLYLLRRMGADVSILRNCYIIYIRPVLEYCAPVWNSAITKLQSKSIESVQKRALRIICNDSNLNYVQRLFFLKLPSLSERRVSLSISFAKQFAVIFPSLIPPTRYMCSGRITRQSNQLNIPYARTKRYQQSPLIRAFEILNFDLHQSL